MDIKDLLFYKNDSFTGERRIGKTKTISVVLFILFFIGLFNIYWTSPMFNYSLGVTIVTTILVDLMFLLPITLVGYLIGKLVNSGNPTPKQQNYNQNYPPYNQQQNYNSNYPPYNYQQNNYQQNQNSYNEFYPININLASKYELDSINNNTSMQILSKQDIKNIIDYRQRNGGFNSYDELANVINLTNTQIQYLKNNTVITPIRNSNNKQSNKPIKSSDKNPKNNNQIDISKINFNTASRSELNKIKELKYNDIEKIINLREHGITFSSYNDITSLKNDLKILKPIIKKFDINQISREELLEIKEFKLSHVNKIVSLRESGVIFKSYADLEYRLNLTYQELATIKKYNNINFGKTNNDLTEENAEKEIININEADLDNLKKIPYMNIYKINTILDLRKNNIYITSFDDLRIKLSFTSEEINELKNYIIIQTPEPEKIDINKANMVDLAKIGIPNEIIAKIILNRNNGIYVSSYDELKEQYSLNNEQIVLLKEVSIITPIKNTNSEKNKQIITQENKENIDITEEKSINEEKTDIEDNEDNKIDLNKADLKELTKINSINLIKAKKIIELRNQGNYIKSYDDLKEKLSLNPNQIQQIKDETTISEPKIIKKRVLDL